MTSMTSAEKIPFIKADNLNYAAILHGFFGRIGGVSRGLYSSLNCSKYIEDDSECVEKNLHAVAEVFGIKRIITMHQVHGTSCVIVDSSSPDSIEDADALVTSEKNIGIGVLTADCAPILFFDEKNPQVAVAHAGWKGAVKGVIESTIEKMCLLGTNPSDLKVAVGPCVGQKSYEVSDDFIDNFNEKYDSFCKINNILHFSIEKYCLGRLCAAGVPKDNIFIAGIDTFANNDQYFSYRFANKFTGGICGRNLSVISIMQL